MLDLIRNLFNEGFIPHGHCYLWKPGLVWLHILSDGLIALAYYSIPITLLYFVRKRQDLPFKAIFLLFGLFIVSCGTTHVMEIWTLWHPTYWLSGVLKAITAIVSIYTASELIPLIPKALALPSPAQLEQANRELQQEVSERQQVEAALRESENRFRRLIQELDVGLIIQSPQTEILLSNSKALELLDLTEDQLLGKTSFDPDWNTIHEDGSPFPGATHPAAQAIATRQPVRSVVMGVYRPSLHNYVWLLVNADPQLDDVGNVKQVICTFSDITQRKQVEEMLRQQAEQERIFSMITNHIRQSLDLTDILNTAVAEVRRFLHLDRVLIYRFNRQRGGDMVATAVGSPEFAVSGESSSASVIETHWHEPDQTGYQSAIADIALETAVPEAAAHHIAQLGKVQSRAKLVLPILHGDAIWGLLVAQQCHKPRQWLDREVELLQQLTTQLAIAIQQAELYQQVQYLNADLEQQVQERTAQLQRALYFETALKRITDQVRDSLDETKILQTAVEELALTLGVECCDTALYSQGGTISTITHEYNRSLASAKGYQFRLEDAPLPEIYGQLSQGQYCQFCPTIDSTIRFEHQSYTVLACPLFDDQGILGDLWLFKQPQECFNELEVRLVQQVANQCAIGVRQARLYQAAQAQVRELQRLNQLKDDFLSTVSHELRTPITSMTMAVRMLEISLSPLGVLDGGVHPADRYFKILRRECERETNLINDLLDLARLDADVDALVLAPIDLAPWVEHLVESFEERVRSQHQSLQVDIPAQLPFLTTNLAYLEQILIELLHNACKYTPSHETIVISATSTTEGVQLCVSNSGIEIPAAEIEHVFEKFYRVPNHDPWKYGGTGLGLALVEKRVKQLQGTIAVSSAQGWTTFTLKLPWQLKQPLMQSLAHGSFNSG